MGAGGEGVERGEGMRLHGGRLLIGELSLQVHVHYLAGMTGAHPVEPVEWPLERGPRDGLQGMG